MGFMYGPTRMTKTEFLPHFHLNPKNLVVGSKYINISLRTRFIQNITMKMSESTTLPNFHSFVYQILVGTIYGHNFLQTEDINSLVLFHTYLINN